MLINTKIIIIALICTNILFSFNFKNYIVNSKGSFIYTPSIIVHKEHPKSLEYLEDFPEELIKTIEKIGFCYYPTGEYYAVILNNLQFYFSRDQEILFIKDLDTEINRYILDFNYEELNNISIDILRETIKITRGLNTDIEKIKAIIENIKNKFTYSRYSSFEQSLKYPSIYQGVWVTGEANCEGISYLFAFMCNYILEDYSVQFVAGSYEKLPGGHAWNKIIDKKGNTLFYVDLSNQTLEDRIIPLDVYKKQYREESY